MNIKRLLKIEKEDPQDKAYREAVPFTDQDLRVALASGELEIYDQNLIKTVEQYEAEAWDQEREA